MSLKRPIEVQSRKRQKLKVCSSSFGKSPSRTSGESSSRNELRRTFNSSIEVPTAQGDDKQQWCKVWWDELQQHNGIQEMKYWGVKRREMWGSICRRKAVLFLFFQSCKVRVRRQNHFSVRAKKWNKWPEMKSAFQTDGQFHSTPWS